MCVPEIVLPRVPTAEGEEESLLAPAAQGSAGAGPSGSGSGAAASSAAPLGGDQQQQQAQQQQQQDMQATLRALSEQAPSFAGGSEQPGSEGGSNRGAGRRYRWFAAVCLQRVARRLEVARLIVACLLFLVSP